MTNQVNKKLSDLLAEKGCYIPYPTIAEAVMWLYEKHRIWISVTKEIEGFEYVIDNKYGLSKYKKRPYSPTEAYESAITYTLKNLL